LQRNSGTSQAPKQATTHSGNDFFPITQLHEQKKEQHCIRYCRMENNKKPELLFNSENRQCCKSPSEIKQ